MPEREELTGIQKRFLVQRLAEGDTPTQAAKAFKAEFDIELKRNRVAYYDPTTKFGAALPEELKTLFFTIQKKCFEDVDSVPIANLGYRLRRYNRMAIAAEERGNFKLAAELQKLAAEDKGGALTNRRELTGKGGTPLPAAAQVTIFQLPDNGRG
jgi:hypothetical protein